MLTKILSIENVGLLSNAVAKPVELAAVTAIYAENARGKTTFAAILRDCSEGSARRVHARQTIDSVSSPHVSFLAKNGSANIPIELISGRWTAMYPDVLVFDTEFIDENVYSGIEVRPDHRRSLLDFALGEIAVLHKRKVDQVGARLTEAAKLASSAEKELYLICAPLPIGTFITLEGVDPVMAKSTVDALEARISAARRAQELRRRRPPEPVGLLECDWDALLAVLQKQLADIDRDAELRVQQHINRYGHNGLENWISEGQVFVAGDACPFCGQGLGASALVTVYRSYFSAAYAAFKAEIAGLEQSHISKLGEHVLAAILNRVHANEERITAWRGDLALALPTLDVNSLRERVSVLREQLKTLVQKKRNQPLELVAGRNEVDSFAAAVRDINDSIVTYNSSIEATASVICSFLNSLATDDPTCLSDEVLRMSKAAIRNDPSSVAAVTAYEKALQEKERLEKEKSDARDIADRETVQFLDHFAKEVNRRLAIFGAPFSIEKMTVNYKGGKAEGRAEYALALRKVTVKLGSKDDSKSTRCFGSVLSESDKRTLAFSFFLARLSGDPKLADKTVVIDDPMCSFDMNRKFITVTCLCELATKVKQLIVLSHDAYFLRSLQEELEALRPAAIKPIVLQIRRGPKDYSVISDCDIEALCESEYNRHHRLVSSYMDGTSTTDLRDVAKAIRPMLEGFYHRRFPRMIRRRTVFGQIIRDVNSAQHGHPLTNLQPLVQKLNNVNDYASRFHHDTNSQADSVAVTDAELKQFAQAALDLVYRNA